MSEADRDGKFAEMLHDRLACLAIEMNESIRDAIDDCPTCAADGREHVVCRECGAHFRTIMRVHDGLCFDCTPTPN